MITTIPIIEVPPENYKKFTCGTKELDEYLARFARTNHKKGIRKSFIEMRQNVAVGYYTVSMGAIEFTHLPESSRQGIPKYPIPVARIGRLAVDINMQGKGFGAYILWDAFHRILEASRLVAAYAIVVDAKNDSAKRFYEYHGFTSLASHSYSLFLPLKTIQEVVSSFTLASSIPLSQGEE